ncbi:dephospho-CoA kinase [Caminicella sporogenes]|uniref:dephospho-CoA kinase n=1 Tax=Caminicella sporogenes TaxID=166485 RepID=UPI00254145DC|nr:dephospho-CoA kinase [Caminicella sporogenes]WIF94398.1 dephospho-CoA kinase [Caminicella sporogenes]
MKVIGLTGGIASGKSTVSSYLKELGAVVIDADIVAREIVEKGKPALKEIVKCFGKEVLNEDGTLNRKYLGKIVFNNPEKLKILNKITHERIIKNIKEKIKFYEHLGKYKVIFIDAALLIEMNMTDMVDEVWLVAIDREKQIERLMIRDKLTYDEALKRINSQMSLEEKKKYADVIIDNSKSIKDLKRQIDILWNKIFGGA